MKQVRTFTSALLFASSCFAIGDYDFSDLVPPSQNPPGGLKPNQVPMFITLGVDDLDQSGDSKDDKAIGPMGIRYLINYFETKKNSAGVGNAATYDGTPARIAFYLTSVYLAQQGADNPNSLKWIINEAWAKGHEIGLHSQTHGEQIKAGDKSYLLNNEIQPCIDWLTKPLPPTNQPSFEIVATQGAGIPLSDLFGWRTPFLAYGKDMLPSLKEKGITYDCSIEEGNSLDQDGRDFRWPYTMEAGSPGHTEGWSGNPDNKDHFTVPNIPGFWQLPNHVSMLPPDDLCAKYGLDYSIRKKMYDAITKKAPTQEWYKPDTDRFTCFDYNYWAQFGLSGKDVTAILKYTLDLRLEGNRAPFMIGAHDAWFHKSKDATPGVAANYLERQKAYADFFDYALSKSEVRVVRPIDIIDWCRNPVALDNIHYKVTTTVVPDTAANLNNVDKLPEWDATATYEKNKMEIFHKGHRWQLISWYCNGVEPGVSDKSSEHWSDLGPAGGVKVTIGGSIAGDSRQVVKKGNSFSIAFTPETNLKVAKLVVNGKQVPAASSFSSAAVNENLDIRVTFGESEVGIVNDKTVPATQGISTRLLGSKLQITGAKEGAYAVSIYSLSGRKLFTQSLHLNSGTADIALDGIADASAMLILELKGSGVQQVQKITR